uniref:Putative ovule protein n=1 Tax=Solanum chacoense TaxID=4108 RepID=A0A0V0GSK6_SOLCH
MNKKGLFIEGKLGFGNGGKGSNSDRHEAHPNSNFKTLSLLKENILFPEISTHSEREKGVGRLGSVPSSGGATWHHLAAPRTETRAFAAAAATVLV